MVVKSGLLLPPGNTPTANDGSSPPQVPPRMKKKRGPALPEKPPHLRLGVPPSSQQDLQDIKREVLVAASKGARERPVDKRQREPAKLLVQISKGGTDAKSQDNRVVLKDPLKERLRPLQDVNRKPHKPLQEDPRLIKGPQLDPRAPHRKSTGPRVLLPALRGSDPRKMMLIPVSEWRSSAVWRPPPPQKQQVVVRTGSLTSQEGSSGSDSETFPKSALKKQRLRSSGRKGGKNVTFNAFATVQVMEA